MCNSDELTIKKYIEEVKMTYPYYDSHCSDFISKVVQMLGNGYDLIKTYEYVLTTDLPFNRISGSKIMDFLMDMITVCISDGNKVIISGCTKIENVIVQVLSRCCRLKEDFAKSVTIFSSTQNIDPIHAIKLSMIGLMDCNFYRFEEHIDVSSFDKMKVYEKLERTKTILELAVVNPLDAYIIPFKGATNYRLVYLKQREMPSFLSFYDSILSSITDNMMNDIDYRFMREVDAMKGVPESDLNSISIPHAVAIIYQTEKFAEKDSFSDQMSVIAKKAGITIDDLLSFCKLYENSKKAMEDTTSRRFSFSSHDVKMKQTKATISMESVKEKTVDSYVNDALEASGGDIIKAAKIINDMMMTNVKQLELLIKASSKLLSLKDEK